VLSMIWERVLGIELSVEPTLILLVGNRSDEPKDISTTIEGGSTLGVEVIEEYKIE